MLGFGMTSQRGTFNDSCHEFRDAESRWRPIRNQQCHYRRQLRWWPSPLAHQSFLQAFVLRCPFRMRAAGVSPPVAQQLEEQETLLGAIRTEDPNGRVAIDRAFVDRFA